MSDNNYTEAQIQAMIEKIKKVKPEEATRERAIKILDMLPEVAGDITDALKEFVNESEKKPLPN
ncbi:MAG: hypothetical protein ACREHC_05315 [Candidatus Levyibacteriota bacterium]